jgi:hypothetical protein
MKAKPTDAAESPERVNFWMAKEMSGPPSGVMSGYFVVR